MLECLRFRLYHWIQSKIAVLASSGVLKSVRYTSSFQGGSSQLKQLTSAMPMDAMMVNDTLTTQRTKAQLTCAKLAQAWVAIHCLLGMSLKLR